MDKEGFRRHYIWIREGYEERVMKTLKPFSRFLHPELDDKDELEDLLEQKKQPILSVEFARRINLTVCDYPDGQDLESLIVWKEQQRKNHPELIGLADPPASWVKLIEELNPQTRAKLTDSILSVRRALGRAKGLYFNFQSTEFVKFFEARKLADLILEHDDVIFYKEEIFAALAFRPRLKK